MTLTKENYYSIPYISNSFIGWFSESPKYAKKKLDNEIEEENKYYLSNGTKIHMSLLEPEKFNSLYAILDVTIPKTENQRKFAEEFNKTKDAIEAYKNNYATSKKSDKKIKEESDNLIDALSGYLEYLDKRTNVKEVLSTSQAELIKACTDSVLEHKFAKKLIGSDNFTLKHIIKESEYPIEWKWKDVNCKALLDRLIIDKKKKTIDLIDLKTTNSLHKFEESFENYSYYRQLAFYWMAIYFKFGKKYNLDKYTKNTYIIAVQTSKIIETKVFNISEIDLNKGFDEINKKMVDIKWHLDNNKWDYSRTYYEGNGVEIF